LLQLARLLLLQSEYLTSLGSSEGQKRSRGRCQLTAALSQNNHLATWLLLNEHGGPPLLTIACRQHLTHKYWSA